MPEFEITCGHRPFSMHFIRTAERNITCSDSAADHEVYTSLSLLAGWLWTRGLEHEMQSGAGKAKKRVTHDTFAKWQRDLDRDCQTMT